MKRLSLVSLFLFLAALLAPASATAQWDNVYGTQVRNAAGGLLANGQFCVQPVDNNNRPVIANVAAYVTTGHWTSGTSTITLDSTPADGVLRPGAAVSSFWGIPVNTKLVSWTGTTVTISNPATLTASGSVQVIFGGGAVVNGQACTTITNGAFGSASQNQLSAFSVPDTGISNPLNLCLRITITDTNQNGKTIYTAPCAQPSNTAPWCFWQNSAYNLNCNFDVYSPALPTQVVQQMGIQGPQGPVGPPGPQGPAGTGSLPAGISSDGNNGLNVFGAIAAGKAVLTNGEYSNGTCATAATINPANGNRQKVTLTGGSTCILAFTQPSSGTASIQLKIVQAASGYGAIGGNLWPGGAPPTITQAASAVDFVSCYLDGANAYCAPLQNFQYAQTATPTYNVLTGTFNNDQSVTISDAQPSASISYCTDTSGTCTPSTSYSSAVTINATGTHLRARALASSFSNSPIQDQTYTLVVGTPSASPPPGVYGTTQTVTLTSATSAASLVYCIDTANTCTPGTAYSAPVSVTVNHFLRSTATKTNYGASGLLSAVYTNTAGASHSAHCQNFLGTSPTSIPCSSSISVTTGDTAYIWYFSGSTGTSGCPAGASGDVTGIPGGSTVTVKVSCVQAGTSGHYYSLYQVVMGGSGTYTPAITVPAVQYPAIILDTYANIGVGVIGSVLNAGASGAVGTSAGAPSVTPTMAVNQIVTGFWWNSAGTGESSVTASGSVPSFTFATVGSNIGSYWGSATSTSPAYATINTPGSQNGAALTAMVIQ